MTAGGRAAVRQWSLSQREKGRDITLQKWRAGKICPEWRGF